MDPSSGFATFSHRGRRPLSRELTVEPSPVVGEGARRADEGSSSQHCGGEKRMTENNFVYPKDVSAFGFDWGRLALTVAPETNGAKNFSGGVVDLPPGQGHARHNHPGA